MYATHWLFLRMTNTIRLKILKISLIKQGIHLSRKQGQLCFTICDKRDDFNWPIVNVTLMSNTMPDSLTSNVCSNWYAIIQTAPLRDNLWKETCNQGNVKTKLYSPRWFAWFMCMEFQSIDDSCKYVSNMIVIYSLSLSRNRIGDIIVSVFAWSRLETRSSQTKDIKSIFAVFPLCKDWLSLNQQNMSWMNDMSSPVDCCFNELALWRSI
jgi:hypothetical protein